VTDRGARRWDPATGRAVGGFEGAATMTKRTCSEDGRRYAWAQGDTVRVIDVATGAVVRTEALASGVSTMRFDPAGERLALGCHAGELVVVSLEAGETAPVTLPGRQQTINAICWSRDGGLIASASRGAEIWTREARTGRFVSRVSTRRHGVREMAFDPSGEHLAAGLSDGSLHVIEVREAREVAVLGRGDVRTFRWSPDGSVIATGTADGITQTWDLAAIEAPADRLVERVFELTGLRVQGFEPVAVTNRLTLVGR